MFFSEMLSEFGILLKRFFALAATDNLGWL